MRMTLTCQLQVECSVIDFICWICVDFMFDMRLAIRKEETKRDKGRCGEMKVGDEEIGVNNRRKESKRKQIRKEEEEMMR